MEEGAAVLLTWLSNVAQLQPLGLVVKDRAVKIITSGAGVPWAEEQQGLQCAKHVCRAPG